MDMEKGLHIQNSSRIKHMTSYSTEFNNIVDKVIAYLKENQEPITYLLVYDADTVANSNGPLAGKEILCIPSANGSETDAFVDHALKEEDAHEKERHDLTNYAVSQSLKIAVKDLGYKQEAISPVQTVTFAQTGLQGTYVKAYYTFTPPTAAPAIK